MAAITIDGRAIAADLRVELTRELEDLKARGAQPGIATLLVGDDFGAALYRSAIEKFCAEMGLGYRSETLPADETERAVVEAVESLNRDPRVSGILPLRPFPAQVSDLVVINSINPDKDVDCFHPFNMGRLALNEPTFPPATPAACLEVLEHYLRSEGRDPADALQGAEICIVGHSSTVGKPLALLLLNRNATITVTHVHTFERGNLARHTIAADYLVVATGVPHLVGAELVKEGAVVLDVGVNRVALCPDCGALGERATDHCHVCGAELSDADLRTVGDVDYDAVIEKVRAITPVPGGVGAVTNMMLARNTLRAARLELDSR